MKLKTIVPKKTPQEGDYKIKRRFAWWPRRVQDKIIWLEKYNQVYEFRTRRRVLIFPGTGLIHQGVWGGWDLITEQLKK